jgi:NAD+ diphosphatase
VEANTFSGATLDRAGEHRADDRWVAERAADPNATAVIVGDGGVLLRDGRIARVPLAETGGAELLLGIDDQGPVFAADARAGEPLTGLRDAAATLPQADGGLAAYAAAMLGWHRRHRFCANCGHATDVKEAGHLRACPNCGAEHHPRTDPVVIMLVERGDDILLGRQPRWPKGRYSALAGFVEPGETLEEAVAREVREESGIEIGTPRYVSSQPWPFPMSLMLGFVAPWEAGEPRIGDEELEDVRWFTRAELADAAEGRGALQLPPPLAIARRLVDGWLART